MEGSKGSGGPNELRDTYNAAYLIHFLLGAGNLLPWNALITAVDYFGYLYPNKHVDKAFPVAYMGSSLLVLVLLMCCSSWNKLPRFRTRMNLGFSLFILALMTAPIMDWIGHKNEPGANLNGAYGIIILAVTICGLADGLIGGSLIGAAGELPGRYMQAVFAGTASSGVLVCILRIITKASLPQTPKGLQTSAHFYFIISTFIVFVCIICCNILDKLPVIQNYQQRRTMARKTQASNFLGGIRISMSRAYDATESNGHPRFWNVFIRIRWAALGILVIYAVTLSIFPGYLAENVESKLLQDWYPILLITTYNVSDLLGKSMAAIYVLRSIGKVTWGCIARLLFYPLFAACLHGPKWLRSEFPVIFLTGMLGLTNGYLTSVLMILAPKSVPDEEAETAGFVMALFLAIGLATGSVIGWFWII